MLSNLDKRYNNSKNTFLLGGPILETVDEETDSGVMIRKALKASQFVKVVKTANQVLGMIKRIFIYKTKENLLQLYKSLVRLHGMLFAGVEPLSKEDID